VHPTADHKKSAMQTFERKFKEAKRKAKLKSQQVA